MQNLTVPAKNQCCPVSRHGGLGPGSHATGSGSGGSSAATPRQLGYSMPCECDPHAGTWMSFPHDPFLWRDRAAPAQRQMAELVKTIAQYEQVWMLTDPKVYDVAEEYFRHVAGVDLVQVPTNEIWVRDWGPTCLVRDVPPWGPGGGPGAPRREVAALHFDYNCYGSPLREKPLLPDWSKDRAAGRTAAQRAGLRAFECPLHLEGGAVMSNGRGTLLVTEECLLCPNRNPELSKAEIERLLKEYLGVDRVVWLWRGVDGDEATNGHVDNVACFADPDTVLLAWCDDPADPMHEICVRNLEALEGARREHPEALGGMRVVRVPCPDPPVVVHPGEARSLAARSAARGYGAVLKEGLRLPASYINHYVINGAVVVPQFGGEQARSDEAALAAIASAHPGRRVVGVGTRELMLGGGNVHCLTQNMPAGEPGPVAKL